MGFCDAFDFAARQCPRILQKCLPDLVVAFWRRQQQCGVECAAESLRSPSAAAGAEFLLQFGMAGAQGDGLGAVIGMSWGCEVFDG